jgi:hypothetical protein
MKHRETKKAVQTTITTIAIAILATALAFPTMATVAIAQSNSNYFQEFMECLFNDVVGSTGTAQDIEDVLQGNSAGVTEQQIRDCFSPIYNDGSDDNTGSSNSNNNDDNDGSTSNSNNNGDDQEDSTEETDSTDITDNTENDGMPDETDGADVSGDNEDVTSGDTANPNSTPDSTDNNTQ